ncbi:hypothetical protein EDO6_04310 [Paenibacillus xylanexedens]|nr:hypothetical protein EDO6_04310 [Paenibacillus xylanexedens]
MVDQSYQSVPAHLVQDQDKFQQVAQLFLLVVKQYQASLKT